MNKLRVTFNTIGSESPSVIVEAEFTKEQLSSMLTKRVAASQSVSVPNARRTAVHSVLTERLTGVTVSDASSFRATATLDDIVFN